jgi:hypothetical protein
MKMSLKKKKKSVSVEEFWQLPTIKKQLLTIGDILNLKKGKTIKLLGYDRNFYDNLKESDRPRAAKTCFQNCSIWKYTHHHDLCGKVLVKNGDHIMKIPEWQFQINFFAELWFPLDEKGCLDVQELKVEFGRDSFATTQEWKEWKAWLEQHKKSNKIHYSQLPPSRLVGWRGPMIRWKAILDLTLPLVRYES